MPRERPDGTESILQRHAPRTDVAAYIGLFECGMLAPTPSTAWGFFQRLNRRIRFEAVPIAVSDYLAQVDATLG